MILEGRVKRIFEYFGERANEIEAQAKQNGGKAKRDDLWRYQYYKQPYLILENDEVILERFADVFTNCLDISEQGKIELKPMMQNNARLARFFTEVIEETNWRGILHKESMQPALEQINAYYEDGLPLGVTMFKLLPRFKENYLYKFSKKEFVQEMYKYGRFRISPASYYQKGSHIKAIKDLETERHYRLKAIDEVINGLDSIKFNGREIKITNGVVPVDFVLNDYYLFSTCNQLSRRMPTDFESDSVLIIKDKKKFIQRFRNALLSQLYNWEFLESDVYYYDAYHDIPKNINQEFNKHISYAYQREHRCILRPKNDIYCISNLSHIYVELGSLKDICEVVYS